MARDVHECFSNAEKNYVLVLATLFLIIQGTWSQQTVEVQPEVVSYPGNTVTLSCAFSDQIGIQLTQVSWIWETNEGVRDNIAVYHPKYGPSYPESPFTGRISFPKPDLKSPSIVITDVKMTDEGKYTCEFATYPTGNEQGTTELIVLSKPKNKASPVTVTAGEKPVVVARCDSENGKPPSQIKWVTVANGNGTVTSKTNADSTVTVSSEYRLVPKPAFNGKDISCVISHRTLEKPQSIPMKLAIEYPPVVDIVGYDNNWYIGRTNAELTCQATGNPVPISVVWKALSGPMPDSVQVKDNKMLVLKVDDRVNTTFVCEVKNRLGVGKDQVTVMVREPPKTASNAGVVAGAIIGSLLALLLVGALIAVLVTRSRRRQQGYGRNANQDIKTRIFGGKKSSKNGAGGNNNGPIYTYRESDSETLTEKSNNINRDEGGVLNTTPSAHDILLSNDLDESERQKFDELEDVEEEEERYDHFRGSGPILQIRPQDEEPGGYLDDDMESQRDGSVISRTAVYV